MESMGLLDNWNKASEPVQDNSPEQELYISKLKNLSKLDDPIEPYLEYIDYIKTHNLSQQFLIEVLEKCTHDFKDDDLYKDDVRYLKVWLQYIEFSDSPYDVYLYLFKKRIGFRLGLFYQSLSNYLEQVNDYQKCFEVYKFGIDQPGLRNVVSLRESFQSFRQRLVNYEKLSGPVDPNCESFLVRMGGKRALDSLGSSTNKKLKHHDELYCSSYQIIKIDGKPDEKWKLNLKLLYTENGEEFTPEEIMCKSRGIYGMKPEVEQQRPKKRTPLRVLEERKTTITVPLKDITETYDNNDDDKSTPASPTMFTKEANADILSIFNKPIQDENKLSSPANIVQQLNEKSKFQVKQDTEEEEEIPMTPEYENEEEQPQTPIAKSPLVSGDNSTTRRTNLVPFMTPIPELTETSSRVSDLQSSPFIEDPSPVKKVNSVINPLDDQIRSDIIRSLKTPLFSYSDYHVYNSEMNKLPVLRKIFSSSVPKKSMIGNKKSMIEFDNELYCVREKLGEGGYATVFLAESSTGELDAIKLEKPANPWEFYILKQIEQKLSGPNSIIKLKSLNLFEDEGYLILEYLNQGTLLDLVNHYKSKDESIDEKLIMFIMVELINTVNSLHKIQIIHGDLKPDNCMLKITQDSFLKIIDFGRSIDMSMLPEGVKFKSNWETDNQDCPEMRKNETWDYEVDYFGLANILHTLLFQDSIQVIDDKDGYKLKAPIKRYWNEDWNLLFEVLLNSKKITDVAGRLKDLEQNFTEQLETSKTQLGKIIQDLKDNYQA